MDVIEGRKNLALFKHNLQCIEAYNHLYSTIQFEQSMRAQRKKLIEQISNIEWQLKQVR